MVLQSVHHYFSADPLAGQHETRPDILFSYSLDAASTVLIQI
jgi:hypothetical protein